MSGITARVRAVVLERDGWMCRSCGRSIDGPLGYSLQHRIPRGMGGSKDPRLNMPGNLITVCGSATTGCHGWMEKHRRQAEAWGYLLHRNLDPTRVPVFTVDGWVLFDNDGGIAYVERPNVTAEKHAELDRDIARGVATRTGTPIPEGTHP